jgi:DNA topoisomerase-1
VDSEREIKIFEEQGISVLKGRYGPYVTNGKKNARVPKDREPETLTLEECVELIASAKPRPKRKRAAKKKKTED